MAPPQKKTLPSKESSLFKELLQLYETKQLKKGVKTADQILKKFPEHGGAWRLLLLSPHIHVYTTTTTKDMAGG